MSFDPVVLARRLAVVGIGGLVALLAARRVLAAGGLIAPLDEPPELRGVTVRDSGIDRVEWSRVRHFRPAEFGALLDQIDPAVIYAADHLRARLGSPLMVSPAPGATARTDEGARGSQHWAVDRRATALDLMPTMATLSAALDAAMATPMIGGIGVYPDAKPFPMVHIDVRPRKTNGQPATWMGLRDSPEEPWHYVAIDRGRLFA